MEKGRKASRADKGYKVNNGNPVSKINVTTGCQYYRVDLRHNASGRTVTKSFSTPQKAASFASRCMARLCAGREKASHPADQQREAMKILNPLKVSLHEAALFYARYHGACDHENGVESLVARYIEEKEARVESGGLSPASLKDIRHFLKRFASAFGSRPVDLVTPGDLDAFLDELNGTANRRSHRLYSSAFFNWAVSCGYLDSNPIGRTRRIPQRHQTPAIYDPSDVQRMMDTASSELLPYLALRMFIGSRSGVILRLKWKDVDFKKAEIKLRAASSGKSRKRKSVPMPPNLMQILLPYRDKQEACVVPHEIRSLQRWMKKLLQELDIDPIYEGTRQTFTAYHLALHPLTETMHVLGCSTSEALLRYCRLCSADMKKQAEAYFDIAPVSQGEIIPLKQKAAA